MSRGYVSAADLSDKQYLIAQIDANGKAALATSATQDLIGAIKDGGLESGSGVSVFDGKDDFPYVILGGSVNEGDRLTTDGSSKAIADTTATNQVIGRALLAGSATDRIPYEPIPGGFGA